MIRVSVPLRGPGHASCKELSVLTQDGPARHIRFRLRRINHNFGSVLCMGDAKTLRKAADEVLRAVGGYSGKAALVDTESQSSESPACSKSNAFWTVFSKRFKSSMSILSANDTVHILRAFHSANKDTGVYVAAAPVIRPIISQLDKASLIDAVHIFSSRLKCRTQEELFRNLSNHIPNVLWSMHAGDITALLWHLSRAHCLDSSLAGYMSPKFNDGISSLNDIELGTASLAFARHGMGDMSFYEGICSNLSLDCSGEALFRAAWGLHMVGGDVTNIVGSRLLTCIDHVRCSGGYLMCVIFYI
ncbi:hypothetical protein BBOV_III004275 [Babesia bovis T2Bo]|uniref:hypothetical protein n=1 Tax=Babesia bovis T2Bo TaxID=484906 RepID=UPI001C3530F8|nr:hypothetical protein BBOV_III004275 [Babesia bovis T2Bo]KAG6440019.1 hypothetical protein BBOV_III004275 [Babesia bovis T2Bo]